MEECYFPLFSAEGQYCRGKNWEKQTSSAFSSSLHFKPRRSLCEGVLFLHSSLQRLDIAGKKVRETNHLRFLVFSTFQARLSLCGGVLFLHSSLQRLDIAGEKTERNKQAPLSRLLYISSPDGAFVEEYCFSTLLCRGSILQGKN